MAIILQAVHPAHHLTNSIKALKAECFLGFDSWGGVKLRVGVRPG